MGKKILRTPSLEEASLISTTTHCNIMVAWTFWKITNTIYLQNERKCLLEAFINHAMWHIDERSHWFVNVTFKYFYCKRDKLILKVLVTIWHNLCLCYNCCGHSLKRSNSWNKIYMNRVNNECLSKCKYHLL